MYHLGDWYIWQIFGNYKFITTVPVVITTVSVPWLDFRLSTLQHPLAATQFQLLAATEGTNKMHCSVTKKKKQAGGNQQTDVQSEHF